MQQRQRQVRGPEQRYIGPNGGHHRHGYGHGHGGWVEKYGLYCCIACTVLISLALLLAGGITLLVLGYRADPDNKSYVTWGWVLIAIFIASLIVGLIIVCCVYYYRHGYSTHAALHESGIMGPGTMNVNASMGRRQPPRYFSNRGRPPQYTRRYV